MIQILRLAKNARLRMTDRGAVILNAAKNLMIYFTMFLDLIQEINKKKLERKELF
jgi:hypothetical protein